MADLRVRVSGRVTIVGSEGIPGLDFLQRFEHFRLRVPVLRLAATYPPADRLN